MSLFSRPAIQGAPPWGQRLSIEEGPREAAPRQEAAYTCPQCGPVTLTLAANVTPRDAIEHRCGRVAVRDGAPELVRPEYPGYGSSDGQRRTHREKVKSPLDHAKERRPDPAERARLLDEALAKIRGTEAPQ